MGEPEERIVRRLFETLPDYMLRDLTDMTNQIQEWKSSWVEASAINNESITSRLSLRRQELLAKAVDIVRRAIGAYHFRVLAPSEIEPVLVVLFNTDIPAD